MTNLLLTTVTNTHLNPVEDVPDFIPHQFVMQARTFMQNGTHPLLFYKAVARSLPQVPGVENKDAMLLLEAVEIRYINLVNTEFLACNAARTNKDVKATKPVDIYRKYNKDLRAIWKRGGQMSEPSHLLLTELELEQTQSWGDLETPDYLDSYTGEPVIETDDPHEFIDHIIKHNRTIRYDEVIERLRQWAEDDGFTGKAPLKLLSGYRLELDRQAKECQKALNWGEKETEQFLAAQGAFDSESDEDEVVYDDIDTYTPPTLEEKELVLDRSLWAEARDAVYSFNAERGRIFKEMAIIFKKMDMKERKNHTWHGMFRQKLLDGFSFKPLIRQIEKIAKEDIVTAAALYLSLEGDYGVMAEDIATIRGMLPNMAEGVWLNMLDFADAWEDDLLGLKQDSLHKGSGTSAKEIAMFDILYDRTVKKKGRGKVRTIKSEYRSCMPKYDPNPVKTASWNLGFARAVVNGASLKDAESAAWDNFRFEMDRKAAKIYNEVLARTESRKAAQAAFWNACDKKVPHPQEKVAAVKRDGLKLESGRIVNWWLAKRKLEQNELFLGVSDEAQYILNLKDDQKRLGLSNEIVAWSLQKAGIDPKTPTTPAKERLLAKLQELGVGQQIWELLK